MFPLKASFASFLKKTISNSFIISKSINTKNRYVSTLNNLNTKKSLIFPIPTMMIMKRSMANHRHKKLVKLAKGYRGRANRCFTVAKQRVFKARQYAYIGRKVSFY